jgi:dTDP-4-amino-4,6-dideoxygalactose transaminase
MRRRTEVARAYNEAFGAEPALQVPGVEPGLDHAWHLYVLRLRLERLKIGRNQFVELLRERGVGVSVHCIPLHTMHFYQRRYGYRTGDFPVTEEVYSRCLSLPIYPAMSDEDRAYVIETVLAAARENRR